MNISLQALNGTDSDFEKISNGKEAGLIFQTGKENKTKNTGALSVDLASSLINTNAYGKGSRTKNDVIKEAQNTDQKVRHNFMSVMANNMSSEDFSKGLKDGFDLSEVSSEEAVTILDRIKAELAKSGENIVGFTDDISAGELKKITGSEGLANDILKSFKENDIPVSETNVKDTMDVLSKMSEVTSLSDGAVKYMTLNEMEPTIQNIYMAMHATNGQNINSRGFYADGQEGYYAKKPDEVDWKTLEDQVDKILADLGYVQDEEEIYSQAKDNARWMIEESIPLTGENLQNVNMLKNLEFPLKDSDVLALAASSIANEKAAATANVQNEENNLKRAVEINEKTSRISDGAINRALEKLAYKAEGSFENVSIEKALTLKSIFDEEKNGESAVISEKANADTDTAGQNIKADQDQQFLMARRQLEEIRLSMSVSVNLRLLNKGIQIETTPMKQLIGEMNKAIDEIGKSLFPDEPENYAVFDKATSKIAQLPEMPISFLGRYVNREPGTLDEIIDHAKRVKASYENAKREYETLGTQVRSDLGDNIKKAFRNIDDILTEQKLEVSEENRRAIRILGYNKIEISPENIERVRSIDVKLKDITDNLKPGAVLSMIRNGHNPLKMTLNELSSELGNREKDESKREEKYSEFLYKLERNHEISAKEKESYIGIYRLFNRLKVTDNAAIGAVLETGAEMTIGNLLTADRTLKREKKGLDVKIDDSVSNFEEGKRITKSISAQIETAFIYYSQKADTVYRNLEPEKLHAAKPDNDTLLENLANRLEEINEAETAKENLRAYINENAKESRDTVKRSDAESLTKELTEKGLPATIKNLEALIDIRKRRRGRKSEWDRIESSAHLAFSETKKDMLDDLMNTEDYKTSYKEHLEEFEGKINEVMIDQADSYIDVKAMRLVKKQISVMSKMADNDSFEVPVEIDGRYVSMNITLKSKEGGGSKVETSVDTEDYGHISMALTLLDGEAKGIFAASGASSEYLTEYMEKIRENFVSEISDNMPNINIDVNNIGIMYHMSNAADAVSEGENGISDSRTLLRMAGVFVHAIQT
ncbi:MAG: hypothetical protein E7301_10855 [Butyrivibrio sp.]|nr:hypothetical protein [Butyrivibrio sp.]